IGLWIIDGGLILQRVVIRTRDALDQMESVGVWEPKPGHPEFFIEADAVDHQRVAFPAADGVSQESRIEEVGRRMRTPVCVNDAPHMRPATGKDQDTFSLRDFINQQSIWGVELTWTAWRKTPRMR